MAKIRSFFHVLAFMVMATAAFPISVAIAALSGSPTGLDALLVFKGPITCEWVSDDGTQAVFVTSSGYRRFIDLPEKPRAYVQKGERYEVKKLNRHPYIPTRTYLNHLPS